MPACRLLPVAPLLLLCLIAGCAAPGEKRETIDLTSVELQREDWKAEDDERIAELSHEASMELERVVIPSSDGLSIPAYVFTPRANGGEPRPAVIYLHGGEHGTFASRTVKRVAAMVSRGWVVLAPDYRGSSGYGGAFHDLADYGGAEINDVLAARNWLVQTGRAWDDRIAVLGLSHGGYNALMAAARAPEGFAACVDFFGPTDLVYRVTSTPEENPNAAPGDPEKFARMVGVTVEQDVQAYRDRSPRFLAAQIFSPVLILHGTEDRVVDIEESEWMEAALLSAGHPDFRLVRLEGADHGFPPELFDPAWEEAIGFLRDRLAGNPAGGRP
ncbi:MAG: alpha/beta hydrolase family protein [Planctomycetota bacterium]|jgi:dipeptidyl aminopeptidase/acylaminoacyl peptidase